MLMIGDGEGAPVLPWDPTELTGEGLGDMGDGVPVLLETDVNTVTQKVLRLKTWEYQNLLQKIWFPTANLM